MWAVSTLDSAPFVIIALVCAGTLNCKPHHLVSESDAPATPCLSENMRKRSGVAEYLLCRILQNSCERRLLRHTETAHHTNTLNLHLKAMQ